LLTATPRTGGEVPVPIDVHEDPAVVQQLRDTCHDMREPIASVLAVTAAALAEPGLSATARLRFEQISGQAEWLAAMVHELLHEEVNKREERDGTDGTDEICAMVAGNAAGRSDALSIVSEVIRAGRLTWSCDVSVISPAEPVRCTLQPVLLRRVLSNVLSNAARAAGPSGLVTVRIWHGKGLLRLVVEDSGPGFGNVPCGLGLGLAWVTRTVVRHGGRIECASGARGGVCVSLWLP
jgi:signal transduction histidine kinase